MLLDSHQIIDGILEAEQGSDSIGTTRLDLNNELLSCSTHGYLVSIVNSTALAVVSLRKRGIGPCYSSKAISHLAADGRIGPCHRGNGVRFGDLPLGTRSRMPERYFGIAQAPL